jgi:5'-nucleotidase
MTKCQILLTNDDGIRSPGLWAAAETLSTLGFVTVAAPREQSSGTGRSLPSTSDGIIREEHVEVGGKQWQVYAIGGTPAQAVLHGILEIMHQRPDLVVSGINYGENVGSGVTISGTVGAALEAAALGIPALAISLEMKKQYHFSYSEDIDFSVAASFAAYFAHFLLDRQFPKDVHLLKIDVPSSAIPETPWELTRLGQQRYYDPLPPDRKSWDVPGTIGYKEAVIKGQEAEDSDVYVLRKKRLVSVTPMSLDMTSRVDFKQLDKLLRK